MKGYGLNAKQRVSKYNYYWFVNESEGGKFSPCKCKETGHRFDAEMFSEGNYFDSYENAQIASRIIHDTYLMQKYKRNILNTKPKKPKKKNG